MTKSRSAVVRILLLTWSLLVVAIGAAALCWHWNVANLHSRVSADPWLPDLANMTAWPFILGGLCLLFLLLGLWFVLFAISKRRVPTWALPHSSDSGALSMDLSALASASAESFTHIDGVRSATHQVRYRLNIPTIEVWLTCRAGTDVDLLQHASHVNSTAIAQACGDRVAQRVFVNIDPLHSS